VHWSSRAGEIRIFGTFIITGGISAVVNIISRIALNQIMPFEIAVVVAYLIGMATAFILFKFLVFGSKNRPVIHEGMRFTLVNALSLLQVWTASVLLARVVFPMLSFTWHAETVAHVTGLLSITITSYALHKRYTFAEQ
jgi:putative flippase GtrA